jgi:hypothetical protein
MTRLLVLAFVLTACGSHYPNVALGGSWPPEVRDYDDVVKDLTRTTVLHDNYQEVLDLTATLKTPEWFAARAARDIETRGLVEPGRSQRLLQAQADAAGPYELELLVTTWDRRENDLNRGKKSIWRVVLIDDLGNEIEPLEIVKDKRPTFTIRADFPLYGDFATAYIARFPRAKPVLGPSVKQVRLRMSSPRGGVELAWLAGP